MRDVACVKYVHSGKLQDLPLRLMWFGTPMTYCYCKENIGVDFLFNKACLKTNLGVWVEGLEQIIRFSIHFTGKR